MDFPFWKSLVRFQLQNECFVKIWMIKWFIIRQKCGSRFHKTNGSVGTSFLQFTHMLNIIPTNTKYLHAKINMINHRVGL